MFARLAFAASRVRRQVAATVASASTVGAVAMGTVVQPTRCEYAGSTGLRRLSGAPEGAGKLRVLEAPVLRLLFSKVRDAKTGTRDYVFYMDRLMRYLAEEGLASLPLQQRDIQTPCGVYDGLVGPSDEDICLVSIIRAGDSLADVVRELVPGCSVGKILIQRDEEDPEKRAKLFYSKLGPRVAKQHVLLCDPMVATGGSSAKAVEVLKEAGVAESDITFLCIVAAPEGIVRLRESFPEMNIVVGQVDLKLNGDKYIVPGLGDAGDRYFGTVEE